MINPRRLLPWLLATAAAFALFVLAANRHSTAQPNPEKSAAPAPVNEADAALARDIDQILEQSDAKHARWGVFVLSKDGRVIYSHDGDKLFTPASNMKIYTTAVALDLLGADYRWRTSVYGEKQPDAGGVINGDLILYGRGAPDLDSKSDLPALADQLYQRGVRRVRGNIVGDESYFRGEMYGTGWQWNDLQWYYGAAPSALTIDENTVEITIAPGDKPRASASVTMNPNDGYVRLANNAMTGERTAVTSVGINRGLSNSDVTVWGEFPVGGRSFSAFLSAHNPALHAASILKRLLIARGIQVDGDVRTRDFRGPESERFDPQKAIEIAFVESKPLSEIARSTNKESNNLFAELILRTLGKEKGMTAPDPDPRKNQTRGDDAAGTALVRKWLSDHTISTDGIAISDGSGLSRLDLVTPESAARLLMVAAQAPWGKTFHDSLPIAGRDGTLHGRLTNVAGRLVAKTGTLTYNHSLSGYAATASDEILAFSIICNDATGPGHPARTIDAIATRVAHYGERGRENR